MERCENFKIGNPIFVGISCMSGLQIGYGLKFAQRIREENPSCPIIWGGVHPTLLPGQTALNDYVDIVVRGEAESSIVDLADAIENGRTLDDVPGITYKTDDTIKSNQEGQLIRLDDIPLDLPFDLLPMGRYPAVNAGRFHMQTSRGCPHSCGFCYNSTFNKRKWRGKTANRVLDEIEYILKRFPNVKWIDPVDDNFFVDQKRVEQICRGLIERKIKVKWRANCRFDYACRYDRNFIELLVKSGCTELDFGGESGSNRLLSIMNKEVTTDQMIKSVENLGNWGPSIEPYVSWMSGLPTETTEDLNETFNLMDKMSETNPKTQHYGIFVYTPFPSPILKSLEKDGFNPPRSLEEWGNIDVFHFKPPWHTKAYVDKLHTVCAVTRYAFYPEARLNERGGGYKFAYTILNHIAKYRWNHRYFGIPIELKLVNSSIRKRRGYL